MNDDRDEHRQQGPGSQQLSRGELMHTDDAPHTSDMLTMLKAGEDVDIAFVIAGIFNVYIEGQKRLRKSEHLLPDDIQRMFRMCRLALPDRDLENKIASIIRGNTAPRGGTRDRQS
jgi:hypothetical protein